MFNRIIKLTHSRMFPAAVASVLLFILASSVRRLEPDSLLAVSLYKAHLMALGGWGGYWLDRWFFPYARPDSLLAEARSEMSGGLVFALAGLRRALIAIGCLVCVALGA